MSSNSPKGFIPFVLPRVADASAGAEVSKIAHPAGNVASHTAIVCEPVPLAPLSPIFSNVPGKPKVAATMLSEITPPNLHPKVAANQTGENHNPLVVIREESLPALVSPRVLVDKPLPLDLHRRLSLFKDVCGIVYVVVKGSGNPVAYRLGSKKANALIAEYVRQGGAMLRPKEIAEINEVLEAHAEQHAEISDVWHRIAKVEGGVELDLGDDEHTRVRITAGKVEIVTSGSPVLFVRNANMRPMAVPASEGKLDLLKKYLNVSAPEQLLLRAWITYLLAHPKGSGSKFVFLVLRGQEGCGKSILSKVLLKLIDPSAIGVQTFPSNEKDLAIGSKYAHVLAFDNLRSFSDHMADKLCIASTGGFITSRKLYTDDDQQAISLHVALILNGIHSFIDQPDLTQRCLPILLSPIDPSKRKPEDVMAAELEVDLPYIMRGLFELIAKVFEALPQVEVTHPERMIEFSRWLAAMERVDGVAAGTYQELYSFVLRQGQLDTMMNNPLAAAIIEFMDEYKDNVWSDTPSELLSTLSRRVGRGTQFSRDWPQNPIALSKRIAGLQAGLLTQNIRIELSRGKQRTITLAKVGG